VKCIACAIGLILLAFGAPALVQLQTGNVERELMQLERSWNDSWITRDWAFLDRILADDYIGTQSDGSLTTKAQEIGDLKSSESVVASIVSDDLKVRLYKDAAVVTFRFVTREQTKGKDTSGSFRATDTWIMRDGRWQCVANHLSRIVRFPVENEKAVQSRKDNDYFDLKRQASSEPNPSAGAVGGSGAEQELVKLEQEWAEAWVKADAAFQGRIMADDYEWTSPDGEIFTKARNLALVKSGYDVISSWVLADLKVRVYGDAAVVTGRDAIKETYKGEDVSSRNRWTHTWVKRDGRWQCVAAQSSEDRSV
jgi:ketosteroid isomerase-like protein